MPDSSDVCKIFFLMATKKKTGFPRICAHRGLSQACPENTLPAFGAALAVGAPEIEFDLWLTRDGVPVVCHDPTVDRTTDGEGAIGEKTWEEIRQCDAGIRWGEAWRGLKVPRLEEVIGFLDGRAEMNIHIKDPGPESRLIVLVCEALRERGWEPLAYLSGKKDVLEECRRYAPDISRCCLDSSDDPERQLNVALEYGCRRVQLRRHVPDEVLRRAGEEGLIRNLFFSDDPDEAQGFVDRGIDVILTNAAHRLLSRFE